MYFGLRIEFFIVLCRQEERRKLASFFLTSTTGDDQGLEELSTVSLAILFSSCSLINFNLIFNFID